MQPELACKNHKRGQKGSLSMQRSPVSRSAFRLLLPIGSARRRSCHHYLAVSSLGHTMSRLARTVLALVAYNGNAFVPSARGRPLLNTRAVDGRRKSTAARKFVVLIMTEVECDVVSAAQYFMFAKPYSCRNLSTICDTGHCGWRPGRMHLCSVRTNTDV